MRVSGRPRNNSFQPESVVLNRANLRQLGFNDRKVPHDWNLTTALLQMFDQLNQANDRQCNTRNHQQQRQRQE